MNNTFILDLLMLILYYRAPRDMDQTFHTLIHAGAKLDVDEMV
jgi:hypothetical protein